MDCPFAFTKEKKTLSRTKMGIVIVIRHIPGSGGTFIANKIKENTELFLSQISHLVWGSEIPENLNLPAVIIEANDNMRTGSNQVENYSRNKIYSSHNEKQEETRAELQKKKICIISNCSINPFDLENYLNSPKKIKIDGVEGTVSEVCHIIILNLLTIEYPYQRMINYLTRKNYFESYRYREQFSKNDLKEFATKPENVVQLNQVCFDAKKGFLFYNEKFDNNLACYDKDNLKYLIKEIVYIRGPAKSDNLPYKFILHCPIEKSVMKGSLLDIPIELLVIINDHLCHIAKNHKTDYYHERCIEFPISGRK